MAEPRSYQPSMLDAHPAAQIKPLEPALQAKVDAANWPDDLLDRVLGIRVDHGAIESWVDYGFPPVEDIAAWVSLQERIMAGDFNVRLATWADGDMLVDLCANAPENVGDWLVTVERGPNPIAQTRLQENAHILVIEDRRVALGMSASSSRNAYIDGKRTSVHFMMGWRIREGFRGLGLSTLLLTSAGSATAKFSLVSYWYVRPDNASRTWIARVEQDFADRSDDLEASTAQLTASLAYLRGVGAGVRSDRVRPAGPDDLRACVDMINRTHEGLDLFRPYTEDFLDQRLDGPLWGPTPSFIPEVYGWPDFHVLVDEHDRPLACAGLWDRGRDIREIWQKGDERLVVDPTGLMDFGFVEGGTAHAAELIGHLAALSADLGRSGLLAPLEFLPEVIDACRSLDPVMDVRELHVMPFVMPELQTEANVSRPYTDLAYW